jgi:hypothetical protein
VLRDNPPGVVDERDSLIIELRQGLEILILAFGREWIGSFIAVVEVGEERIRAWKIRT